MENHIMTSILPNRNEMVEKWLNKLLDDGIVGETIGVYQLYSRVEDGSLHVEATLTGDEQDEDTEVPEETNNGQIADLLRKRGGEVIRSDWRIGRVKEWGGEPLVTIYEVTVKLPLRKVGKP